MDTEENRNGVAVFWNQDLDRRNTLQRWATKVQPQRSFPQTVVRSRATMSDTPPPVVLDWVLWLS